MSLLYSKLPSRLLIAFVIVSGRKTNRVPFHGRKGGENIANLSRNPQIVAQYLALFIEFLYSMLSSANVILERWRCDVGIDWFIKFAPGIHLRWRNHGDSTTAVAAQHTQVQPIKGPQAVPSRS